MPNVEFPVCQDKQVVFPKGTYCPWCNTTKLSNAPGMAILNAGALQPTGDDAYIMAIDDVAFMNMTWHASDPSADRDAPGNFATVLIADLVQSGQFEMYFCSTECLRGFLNYCVDELELQRSGELPIALPPASAETVDPHRYSTTNEAAEYLSVTRARILSLIGSHRLPATKIGRAWAIKMKDLENLKQQPRELWAPKPRARKKSTENRDLSTELSATENPSIDDSPTESK